MGFPRVAVIVPMYDSGPRLIETLESIVAQTYSGWEAILVDDASNDDTLERAQAFARREPRMRVVPLTSNVGVAGARNVAIQRSRGELVALLDHDDRWREDYLEHTIALVDEARAAGRRPGIVACDAIVETPDGVPPQTYATRFGGVDDITLDSMIQRNRICARALFTRAAYDEVGGFSTVCPGSDDYDLWLRMIEAGHEVLSITEPLAVYRLHGTNLSGNKVLMIDGALATYARALHRGALSAAQQRAVRARRRHYLALHERELALRALADRRLLAAGVCALRATPFCIVAFLQSPARWREWLIHGRGRRGLARITSS